MNGIVFAVIVLAASVVLVAVLAWVSRRLLGLPVGTLRAVIAGLVGFVAALIVGQALRATESGHLAVFFSVALGVPLIVAMIFIVAAEALVPTGAGPQPVELVLRARRSIARSRRYAQISRILVRHGLAPYLQGRPLRGWETADGRAAIASDDGHDERRPSPVTTTTSAEPSAGAKVLVSGYHWPITPSGKSTCTRTGWACFDQK